MFANFGSLIILLAGVFIVAASKEKDTANNSIASGILLLLAVIVTVSLIFGVFQCCGPKSKYHPTIRPMKVSYVTPPHLVDQSPNA